MKNSSHKTLLAKIAAQAAFHFTPAVLRRPRHPQPLLSLLLAASLAVIGAQSSSGATYEPYSFGTFAGLAGANGSADGTGSAARFSNPIGVAVDSAGNVYVADIFNQTIRKITSTGVVTTLAGLAGSIGSADGTGSAARFNAPSGLTVDSAGKVYVADFGNDTIRVGAPSATPVAQLLNISTRLQVQTGDNVLIGGFIITGTQPKKVILRAIGPSLGNANPPVAGALVDPILELHKPDGTIIINDNWKDTQEAEIIASTVPPTNDFESAIVATLDPGAYTAIVSGKNGGTGVGLVEAYDLDQTVDSQLANISTRGFVETGDNVMIGGFIVGGSTSVIVRAIGPSLAHATPPVLGTLPDPTLELHDSNGATLAFDDNWKDTQEAEIIATTIPPTDDLESAIVMTLAPGAYTAIVSGKNNMTGVALVEAYNISP